MEIEYINENLFFYFEDIDYKLIIDRDNYLKNIEIEKKRTLIKNGIFIQKHTPYIFKEFYPRQIHRLKYIPNDKFSIGDEFVLDHKIYCTNPKFIDDICQSIIKNSKSEFNFRLTLLNDDLRYNSSLLLDNEIIELIKNKRSEIINNYNKFREKKNELINSFFDYENYGYKDMKDSVESFLFEYLDEKDSQELIFQNFSIYNLEVFKIFSDSYCYHHLIIYLNNLIANPTQITNTNDLLTAKEKICVLEYLISNSNNWDEYSDNKKGKIASILFNQNQDNSRKFFKNLGDKKSKERTSKIYDEAMKKFNSLL